MNRRQFTLGAVSLLGATSVPKSARAELELGRDYTMLDEPAWTSPTIQVALVFAFGSLESYALHREALPAWEARRPKDVGFFRMHPTWQPEMVPQCRALLTMRTLGRESALTTRAFEAIMTERRDVLANENTFASFLRSAGLDRSRAMDIYHSISVTSQMQQTAKLVESCRVDAVPSFIVDGRYVVSHGEGGSAAMIATVDAVLQRARKMRGS